MTNKEAFDFINKHNLTTLKPKYDIIDIGSPLLNTPPQTLYKPLINIK